MPLPSAQSRRPPGHRRTPSEEEKRRQAKMRAMKKEAELNIFSDPLDPKKKTERRPRRNSESSVRDKPALDPDEEKKRQERKRREAKHRAKAQKRLDVIDKLDVTSIYGTGCK
jgi:hypothetical protein